MNPITILAAKKMMNQPEVIKNEEFWLDFAVCVLSYVEAGLDNDSSEYSEIEEFFTLLPDKLNDRAHTNFDFEVGEGDYPVILEVEVKIQEDKHG